MATLVLIHGAWYGGWVWRDTARALRASGHEVFAPTLTGCGERAHQLSSSVTLGTHINDVASLLYFEGLREVILVGHSYAGAVIAGAAERARGRVGQLIYLDAFTPRAGESVLGQVTWAHLARRSAVVSGGVSVVPPPPAPMLGLSASAEVVARLTPFPLAAFEQGQSARPENLRSGRAFVRCAENADPTLTEAAARARESGWDYREINAPHSAMLTHPGEVAATLHELASSATRSAVDGRAA